MPQPTTSLTAVQVHGPFRGPSGYEHHVREFVRELDRQGVAVELIDLPEWGPTKLPPDLLDPWFATLTAPVGARVALHFCMPHQLKPDPRMIDVNYTMFEATRIPTAWVEVSRACALTVVPTDSSRSAWLESGAPPDRLRLCPLGIRPDLFSAPAEPLPITLESGRTPSDHRVRFLNVSEWGGRKNLDGLLRTWLRATTPSDAAVLVLKLGCFTPRAREIARWHFGQVQRATGKALRDAAPVHIIDDVLADAEMPRLYATATHYISMSHGEGWDLPMMEAVASGLVPVAPDHSAYRTYLDPSVAHMIPSRETPATMSESGPIGGLFAGLNWWSPDEAAAADILRAIIDRGAYPPASARDRVLGEFTWQRATRRLLAILAEAESDAPTRRTWTPPWPRRR